MILKLIQMTKFSLAVTVGYNKVFKKNNNKKK